MWQKRLFLRNFERFLNKSTRYYSCNFGKKSMVNFIKMTEQSTLNSNPDDMEICLTDGSSGEIEVLESTIDKKLRLLQDLRRIEYTSYGKNLRLNNKLDDIAEKCISVVTYNVLSQSLLESHRYLYKNSPEGDLNWSKRSRLLVRDFEELNPDILCLQEVQVDHVESFYEPELKRLGYSGIYKQRTNDKIDGCAIYYRTDKFLLMKQSSVEMFKSDVKLLDRDNIGIVIRFGFKNEPSSQFVVATTHLLYNPRRMDIKLTQTQYMLAEIENLAYIEKNKYRPVIFLGDMNYTPDSAVYCFVSNGSLRYQELTGRFLKYLLPRHLGITDSCQFEKCLLERNAKDGSMKYGTGYLEHNFNFSSVYCHKTNGDCEATTHQDEWVTVDYIFYSCQNKDKSTADLELIARKALPTSAQAQSILQAVPNQICGSDHLPLMATFHFLSRTANS